MTSLLEFVAFGKNNPRKGIIYAGDGPTLTTNYDKLGFKYLYYRNADTISSNKLRKILNLEQNGYSCNIVAEEMMEKFKDKICYIYLDQIIIKTQDNYKSFWIIRNINEFITEYYKTDNLFKFLQKYLIHKIIVDMGYKLVEVYNREKMEKYFYQKMIKLIEHSELYCNILYSPQRLKRIGYFNS